MPPQTSPKENITNGTPPEMETSLEPQTLTPEEMAFILELLVTPQVCAVMANPTAKILAASLQRKLGQQVA